MIRASFPVSVCVASLLLALGGNAGAAPDGQAKENKKYPYLFQGKGLPYSGVTLRGGEPPPAPKPPGVGRQYITWPGFRSDAGAPSEVFMQLTGPVTYKVKQRGTRVYVTIDKVQVYKRNNLRMVVTRHFPGPVTRFRLRRLKHHRYRLEIHLRQKVTPTVELKAQDKYNYLVVTFPASPAS